jgi:hypothetical protein
VGKLSTECVRKFDPGRTAFAVEVIEQPDSVEVARHGLVESHGKEGCAITVVFSFAHDDLVAAGVEILDAQAEALEQTQAGAVE